VRLQFKWERLAVGLTHKLLSCQNVAGGLACSWTSAELLTGLLDVVREGRHVCDS
jgi:hypothetical protein